MVTMMKIVMTLITVPMQVKHDNDSASIDMYISWMKQMDIHQLQSHCFNSMPNHKTKLFADVIPGSGMFLVWIS